MVDDNRIRITAFTDGANMPHQEVKHAGAAAILQVELEPGASPLMIEWGRYLGSQTNNVAELSAIELAATMTRDRFPGSLLTIVTDSQYCQGTFTVVPGGAAGWHWQYRAKSNAGLIERIRGTLLSVSTFEIKWTRGHDGDVFNERADAVAVWCKVHQQDWYAEYRMHSGFPPLSQHGGCNARTENEREPVAAAADLPPAE